MNEKIDEPEKKDTFSELIDSIKEYLNNYDGLDVKKRLKVEKDIANYASKNPPSWLLNLIIVLNNELRK